MNNKPLFVHKPHPEPKPDYISMLVDLQHKVGYKTGPINVIALLGLFGEAGEVLDETILLNRLPDGSETVADFPELCKENGINGARIIDTLKKQIRDKSSKDPITVFVSDDQKFDKELADAFYYLLAIAINRGKTLNDLAELSYKKVMAKSQMDVSHGSVNQETVQPGS